MRLAPVTTTSNRLMLLWLSTMRISVGSPMIAASGVEAPLDDAADQVGRAETSDLLVIRESKMDRSGKPFRGKHGHRGEAKRQKALHVVLVPRP